MPWNKVRFSMNPVPPSFAGLHPTVSRSRKKGQQRSLPPLFLAEQRPFFCKGQAEKREEREAVDVFLLANEDTARPGAALQHFTFFFPPPPHFPLLHSRLCLEWSAVVGTREGAQQKKGGQSYSSLFWIGESGPSFFTPTHFFDRVQNEQLGGRCRSSCFLQRRKGDFGQWRFPRH